jgi:hypothetical protein
MSAESSEALEDSITSLAIDVDTTGHNADEEYISDNVKELLLGVLILQLAFLPVSLL